MNKIISYFKNMKNMEERNALREKAEEIERRINQEISSIEEDMELLFALLGEEWARSSEKKGTLRMTATEFETLYYAVGRYVIELHKKMDGDITFEEYMKWNKECHVLLRIMKKGMKKMHASKKKSELQLITVALDAEEQLYVEKHLEDDSVID